MKKYFFTIAFLVSVSLNAETTVKNSAPFAFPTGASVKFNRSNVQHDISFTGIPHCIGKSAISFSWSLPGAARPGTIALYTLSGALVKALPIASPHGTLEFDLAGNMIARGIYFAKLSYGPHNKNLQLFLFQ